MILVESNLNDLQAMPKAGSPVVPNAETKFINFGRTPAWITHSAERLIVVKVSELPIEPAYKFEAAPAGAVIASNGFHKTGKYLETGGLSDDQMREIQLKNSEVIYYGCLKYHDLFDKTHETRFCFVYNMPAGFDHYKGFRLGGPESYNRQT